MRQLVNSLRLAPAASAAAGLGPDREQLVPDDTLNPLIQRFYWFMGQRALDPQHEVRPCIHFVQGLCEHKSCSAGVQLAVYMISGGLLAC